MTSEVVVMNRLGIALASDSAATVYVGGRAKFYHADKLFMLSNHQPVGVMVYNNSSLLGVPWETILKMFRAHLRESRFDTLQEYSTCLIDYICGNDELFPPTVQQKHFVLLVNNLFQKISDNIREELLRRASEDPDIAPQKMKEVESTVIRAAAEEWRAKKDVDAKVFTEQVGATVVSNASGEIHNSILKYFPAADTDSVNLLYELARLLVNKEEILPESLSGLVIAGFGIKEHFPVMQEFELGEIFTSKLKYRCLNTYRITHDQPSIIKPFAQSEMVETFLHGVSPAFELKMIREIVNVVLKSPADIIDGMPGVSKARKQAYKDKVRPVSSSVAKSVVKTLRDFRHRKHLQPVLQSIEFLPKNELAHVASSLVNLSSFQKRMSISEDETVGGPIDVAVISKGDGFVWIDRKHYFRPELNRHFFRNQTQSSRDGEPSGKQGDEDESANL
jgi:hypothetical protein